MFPDKLLLLYTPKLKGHCAGEAEKGRLTVILEPGAPLQMIQLLQSPWEDRFRVSPGSCFQLLLSCDCKPSGAAGRSHM